MIRSDRYPFLKYGSYALLMLALFVLQSTRGTAIHLWGASVNVMPFFVAAVALLDGPYAGGVMGFFGGVLLNLNSAGLEGFSSLSLSLFGICFGLFGAYYLRPVILSALSGGFLCMVLETLFRYVFHDLLIYNMHLLEALRAFGLELVLSLPAGALAFVCIRAVHRRFTGETT